MSSKRNKTKQAEQLDLNFDRMEKIADTLEGALKRLESTISLMSQQGMSPKPEPAKARQEPAFFHPAEYDIRKRLNKVARLKAFEKELHFREIWIIAYDRLKQRTGFGAMSRALSKGISPLEAVILYGNVDALLEVLERI